MDLIVPHALPDIQAAPDARRIPIQRVGVKAVRHPVRAVTRRGPQPTIATFDMDVALPAAVKGTHMSRFLESLQAFEAPISARSLGDLLSDMLRRLEALEGRIEARMPIFVEKSAPVSKVRSLLDHEVTLRAERRSGCLELFQQVVTPVTSLCPCSKEISLYGAHNQRSHLTLGVVLASGAEVGPEDLIEIAEASASCQLWGLLKRPDEKYVTERAYENPKFVEDLVRDVATALAGDPRVTRYEVGAENFESIHNHSAYAWLAGP